MTQSRSDATATLPARSRLRKALVARRPDFAWNPPPWLAVAAVAVAAAVHIWVAWGPAAIMLQSDEITMLAEAQAIARGGSSWELLSAGYMPGLAIVLAPLWWFSNDSTVVFHASLGVVVALAMVSIIPLAAIARRFAMTRSAAVIIAALVVAAPSRALLSNYVFAEHLLLAVTAATFLAALRYVDNPTRGRAVVLGVAGGSTFLVHGRAVALVAVVGVWLLVRTRRDGASAWLAGTVMAGVSLASYALYRWAVGAVVSDDARFDALSQGFSDRSVGEFVGTMVGQAWYVTAAWPAVAVVGIGLLIRRRRLNGAAMLVPASLAATLLLAAIQLNPLADVDQVARLDLWVYGRYLDHVVTVAVVVGIATMVRVKSRILVWFPLVMSGAVAALFLVMTVPHMPVGGPYLHGHVTGIAHLLNDDYQYSDMSQPWVLLAAATVAIALLVAVAGQIKDALILIFALMWPLLSVATDATHVDRTEAYLRNLRGIEAQIDLLPEGSVVSYDGTGTRWYNFVVFYAHPHDVVLYEPAQGEDPVSDVVYGLTFSKDTAERGGMLIKDGYFPLAGLFVLPGDLYDELEREGRLDAPPWVVEEGE
ncbi:hypothetical protein [Demequina sp.]|uniref:hypothetical protein n=1 Tax=Demequina sp. TaxID=2050685 RepID=UPI0025C72D95|nr:hypothetical protein [Demequina sp.]